VQATRSGDRHRMSDRRAALAATHRTGTRADARERQQRAV